MQYIFSKSEYSSSNIDDLVSSLDNHYKAVFDDKNKNIISNYTKLYVAKTNGEFEDIFSEYRIQIFNILFEYSEFLNQSHIVKEKIHQYRENHIKNIKEYKEESFDSLLDHFGDNFSIH